NGSASSWVATERLLAQVKLPAFNNQQPVVQYVADEVDTAHLREIVARTTEKPPLVVAVDPDQKIAAAFVQLMDDRRPRWLFYGMTEPVWRGLPVDKRDGHYVLSSFAPGTDTAKQSPFARIQAAHGGGRIVFDTTASAYAAVHLWAQAAHKANSTA